MTVLVDTGVFLGLLGKRDPHRQRAHELWETIATGRHGRIHSLDAVYVEAMNYLARKPRWKPDAQAMANLRNDPAGPVGFFPDDGRDLTVATQLYLTHFERGLSMTDCLLLAAAQRMGASIATLDGQFEGLVPLVA